MRLRVVGSKAGKEYDKYSTEREEGARAVGSSALHIGGVPLSRHAEGPQGVTGPGARDEHIASTCVG